jgi:hypothetical protein
MAVIYFFMKYFYQLDLSWKMYFLGYFYILMFYFYLLPSYVLGKSYQQLTAAAIGILGSVVNLTMCIGLIPRFGMEGAMMSGLAAQVCVVLMYRYKTVAHA